jgi:hypothetical protein
MAFSKMPTDGYPRRLWGLYGFPGSGKSTFAARMRGPILAIDADHRFDEVARLACGNVYALSETPADNVTPERIAALLRANMPGADVKTILVDSLTAILAPLVTRAILDNDAGRNKNRAAAFKDKALALRLLQDSVTGWGTDCLWIWHLQAGRDAQANEVETATVSRTELARLTRSLNMLLRVIEEGGRRGVYVDWARRGRSGVTVWDPSGSWDGIPEALEKAVYAGLTEADQQRIEAATPASFPNPAAAIAWGFEQGAFEALEHARNAYDWLKREQSPKTAAAMWALWIADVTARKAARVAAGQAEPAGAPTETFGGW